MFSQKDWQCLAVEDRRDCEARQESRAEAPDVSVGYEHSLRGVNGRKWYALFDHAVQANDIVVPGPNSYLYAVLDDTAREGAAADLPQRGVAVYSSNGRGHVVRSWCLMAPASGPCWECTAQEQQDDELLERVLPRGSTIPAWLRHLGCDVMTMLHMVSPAGM